MRQPRIGSLSNLKWALADSDDHDRGFKFKLRVYPSRPAAAMSAGDARPPTAGRTRTGPGELTRRTVLMTRPGPGRRRDPCAAERTPSLSGTDGPPSPASVGPGPAALGQAYLPRGTRISSSTRSWPGDWRQRARPGPGRAWQDGTGTPRTSHGTAGVTEAT
jgi:hypothetical protein